MLLGVIIVSIAGYVSPVRAYINRSEQISTEKAATSDLRQQHEKLELEKERLQNQLYVEQVARKELGLVKPGEQSYVLKNLDQGGEAESMPSVQEDSSWISSAVEAVGSLLP